MAVMAMCVLLSCTEKKEEATLSGLMKSNFVSEVQGKPTALYVLKNQNGAEACVTNWGGRLVSVMVPDKNGKMTDVVLGYDNIQQYVDNPNNNYGGLIGRYGNRIANGKFTLDGVEYQLPQNNNGHCLHGGPEGYHTVVWDAKQVNDQSVELTYLSKDGEAGFPGNLNLKVTYTLTNDNAVDIKYEATTDKPTVVNLTNHSYFNLSGVPGSQILDHSIMIAADTYVPVDETLIPTGTLDPVEGTPMDFRKEKAIGQDIEADYEALNFGRGYDHTWVIDGSGMRRAAVMRAEETGITMEVWTDLPGVQFYAGNFIGEQTGKGGAAYHDRSAFCLESQFYPNAVNEPDFPSPVVKAGDTYHTETSYRFYLRSVSYTHLTLPTIA